MEVNVCNLEQDGGFQGTGHGDLEERYLVKKREDTAGGVLSGGSFLGRGKVLGVW